MAGQRSRRPRAVRPRRRGRRSGSRRRESARPGSAARPAARPCPCGVRRTGRGTAPTCRAADSRPARGADANDATSTPLGISTASEPSASICQRRARSDTAMRPTIFSCQGRRMPWNTDQRQRFRGRGVEGRDDRPLGDHQRQHRQARRVGFVQVQHVEVALGEPRLDLAVGGRAEPQPGDGPVVRNRDGLAAGHHVVGQLRRAATTAPAR